MTIPLSSSSLFSSNFNCLFVWIRILHYTLAYNYPTNRFQIFILLYYNLRLASNTWAEFIFTSETYSTKPDIIASDILLCFFLLFPFSYQIASLSPTGSGLHCCITFSVKTLFSENGSFHRTLEALSLLLSCLILEVNLRNYIHFTFYG